MGSCCLTGFLRDIGSRLARLIRRLAIFLKTSFVSWLCRSAAAHRHHFVTRSSFGPTPAYGCSALELAGPELDAHHIPSLGAP